MEDYKVADAFIECIYTKLKFYFLKSNFVSLKNFDAKSKEDLLVIKSAIFFALIYGKKIKLNCNFFTYKKIKSIFKDSHPELLTHSCEEDFVIDCKDTITEIKGYFPEGLNVSEIYDNYYGEEK